MPFSTSIIVRQNGRKLLSLTPVDNVSINFFFGIAAVVLQMGDYPIYL